LTITFNSVFVPHSSENQQEEMLKLFLVRHGESNPAKFPGGDSARELSELGIRQIEQLRDRLSAEISTMPKIVCSHAVRTQQTASILAKRWNQTPETDTNIYYGGIRPYEEIVKKFLSVNTLILIGHNPDISVFASEITGADIRFLTSSCAVIELNADEVILLGKLKAIWHPQAH